jgi:DNA-binding response OmpR family regulator
VLVSLDANVLSFGPHLVRLTPYEAEISFVLAERMPMAVRRGFIVERVWGVNEREGTGKGVDVYINRLRRKLGTLGLTIETISDRGFRLVVPAEAAADAA